MTAPDMQHGEAPGLGSGAEDTMQKPPTRPAHVPSCRGTGSGDHPSAVSGSADGFLATARSIVGARHVLTRPGQTHSGLHGGSGTQPKLYSAFGKFYRTP